MRTNFTAFLFAPALLMGAAPQETSSGVAWKRAPGASSAVRLTSLVNLTLTTEVMGDPAGPQTKEVILRREDDFSQRILRAEGGRATQVRIECRRSRRQIGLQETRGDIEGRVFDVKRIGPASSITALDGATVPADALTLGGWENGAGLLPEGPLKVGDEWSVSGSALTGVIEVVGWSAQEAQLKVRLDSIREGQATLLFSGALRGASGQGEGVLQIREGRLVMDVARAAPVSLSLSGGLVVTREVKDVHLEGGLKVEFLVGRITVRSKELNVDIGFQ